MKEEGFFKTDSEYFNDSEDKIELTHCEADGVNCKDHLSVINKSYKESDNFLRNKDYKKSIEALERAFEKTFELQQSQCKKCANLFRTTVIQSLEDMHKELKKSTTGLFRAKRYKSDFQLVDKTLTDLKGRMDLLS